MRVRTVEYEPGWGWIARDPVTGEEVLKDHRWPSRAMARSIVEQQRTLAAQAAAQGEGA